MKVKGVSIQSGGIDPERESVDAEPRRKLGSFSLISKKAQPKNEIIEIIRNFSNNEGLDGNRKTILKEFLVSVYGLNESSGAQIADSLNNILLDAAEHGTDSNLVAALDARNRFLIAAKATEDTLFGGDANDAVGDWQQGAPRKAPVEYRNRQDRSQKASEFLEQHYSIWLRGNGLYQHELRRFDKSLMQGLNNEFRGRFDELSKLIPTKRSEIDARLGPDAANMSTAERKRALDNLRARLD